MNNPLTDVLTPKARKLVYGIYAVLGLLIGAIQVGYGAASVSTPTWLKVALAVFAFVGTGIGAAAGSNVPSTTESRARAAGPDARPA
jgi:hypothetical protein